MRYWDYVTERLPVGPVEWPHGARIAVLVAFDYQSEVGEYSLPNGMPNYAQITEASYGGRVGIWRLLDILDRHRIPATFNTCGLTAELYPETCVAIVQRGHEIAGHTYDHRPPWRLTEAEEREDVQKTIASIRDVTGVRITGWRCPRVQPSPHTLRIMADEGFVWDSNFLNYDLPYMLDVGTKSLVEIPYTFSTDDLPFIYGSGPSYGFPAPRNKPSDLFEIWKDEFDVLYAEAGVSPKMFIWQNHPLVMGRAHRARYFDRFLGYLRGFPDVWFARCIDVANLWLERHNSR